MIKCKKKKRDKQEEETNKKNRNKMRKIIMRSRDQVTPRLRELLHKTIPSTDLRANQDRDNITTEEIQEILEKYDEADGRKKTQRNPIQKPKKLKLLESRSKKRTIKLNNIKLLEK